MKDTNKLLYLLLFVLAFAVNLAGLNIKFFTDDPGLYAAIAKNMIYKRDFIQLFTYNLDWLDKPHFPFWAIACSFKLFGISVWAYRLPALFFFVLGLGYTWLFTRKYYGWEIAAIAVSILMTAQHVILSNTDVRAEPYLMALIIGSIYHLSCLEDRFTVTDLVLAALLTACAIMTKGIFVVAAIYGGLLGQFIFQKKLKQLAKLKWLALLLLTAMFTLPELYALYKQFDLHPEKTVFGSHHVSGIKWFLWDSQFGRFVNNGPITRKTPGSIFFYSHTLLWAFAPWCLLFYYALFKNIKQIYNDKKLIEYYSLSGGLLLLLLFSLSRFQLPFYSNAVFPLFAIVTAPYCLNRLSKAGNIFRLIGQWIFVILLPIVIIVINFLLKPDHDLFFALDCLLFGVIILLVLPAVHQPHKKAFFLNCTVALFTGFYINTIFFNEIVPYKAQIAAAQYLNQKPFDRFPVYTFNAENNVFQFYCKKPVSVVPIAQFNSPAPKDISIYYVTQQSLDYLTQHHSAFRIMRSFIDYPNENILPPFINKGKRFKVLSHVYLITN